MGHQRPETGPSCAASEESFPAPPLIRLSWRRVIETEITLAITRCERELRHHTCVQRGGRSERPDEDESEQLGVFDISRILQPLEEVVEKRQKLLTLLAGGRREEKQRDAVFKDADNLALRVELVLVPVVLHQDSVQEQVHHDEGTRGGKRPLDDAEDREIPHGFKLIADY